MSATLIVRAPALALFFVAACQTVLLADAAALAAAAKLQRFQAKAVEAPTRLADLDAGKKWWAQLGDNVYYASETTSSLGSDAGEYYYALGSEEALSEDLRKRRVGGEGRWHIFHIPETHASLLQTATRTADRRSSISSFTRLKHGVRLATTFPLYVAESEYKSPLSDAGQAVEQKAVDEVTSEHYKAYLGKVTSLDSRSCEDHAASDRAAALLKQEFEALGFSVCEHRFEAHNMQLTNVLAYAPGSGSQSFIVGAHYDSRPYQGPAPGANDNGSGVAALLAMARAFKAANVATDRPVIFAAFAGEEVGLLGSDAFAQELLNGADAIPAECKPSSSLMQVQGHGGGAAEKMTSGAIIMDEIGWLSPNTPKPTVNLESYDSTAEMMQHMLQASFKHNGESLTVVHSNNPFGSDHMSFLDRQVPAVLTINADDEAYPAYHSSKDTIENVNIDYATKITKMNMGALLRMTGVRSDLATRPSMAQALRGQPIHQKK